MMAPARLESLPLIEAACWQELGAAANDRLHEWRIMALATLGDGEPELRSVVLREVDAPARRLVFFTDSRSPKVPQLQAQSRATLLLWSQRLSWQLRLRVHCRVQTDGLEVSSRWARLKLSPAAQDYLSPLQPGTPIERWELDRASREHFAVVGAVVVAMDWLELHADGHRRARFGAEGATWLAP
ncbi:MAG TPA: pyridoxamine 5'-phosphate oxidase family protein [Burkholderiaceae bacterium]|nr:pyridoxamine 5'-phosphate oxidase family protein [Burkholderiaceae bacterium]